MRSVLVMLLLLAAPAALAVTVGGKLYVKSRDTRVRKTPDDKGAAVVTLQPGKEVIWNGASAKAREWHEVTVDGKKGFVHRSDLTPQAPMPELDASAGKSISPEAFAASGYTKCSFGPPASQGSPAEEQAKAELIYLEELNREKATLAALDEKHRELQR